MDITQKSRLTKFFVSITAIIMFFGIGLLHIAPVFADAASDACDGLKLVDPTSSCDSADKAADEGLGKIVRTVVNTLSLVVGAVSVIMIIIGGFRYVISGGDSNGVQGAKNTILYAIVGLVIVLFAQVIVAFVLTSTTKTPEASPADPSKVVDPSAPDASTPDPSTPVPSTPDTKPKNK